MLRRFRPAVSIQLLPGITRPLQRVLCQQKIFSCTRSVAESGFAGPPPKSGSGWVSGLGGHALLSFTCVDCRSFCLSRMMIDQTEVLVRLLSPLKRPADVRWMSLCALFLPWASKRVLVPASCIVVESQLEIGV